MERGKVALGLEETLLLLCETAKKFNDAPPSGFEPETLRLTVECSTVELQGKLYYQSNTPLRMYAWLYYN